MPNLGGLPSRLAIDIAIVASGLIPAYQTVTPVPYGMAGRFAGQLPNAGDKVPYGSVVRYGVYEAAQAAPTAPAASPPVAMLPATPAPSGGVPSVIGDSLKFAQAKLEAAGLRVGGITKGDRPPNEAWAGRVFYQDPAAGSRVRPGGGVALRQYGPMTAGPPVVAPPPVPPPVAGPVSTVQPNCAGNDGPIGCTGSFTGNVYLACDGIAPANYASTFTLRANGSAELQIATGRPAATRLSWWPARWIDRDGTRLIARNGACSTDG